MAKLLRGPGQDGTRQQRIAFLDQRVVSEIAVRHERTYAQASVCCFFHIVERQVGDVDQTHGTFDIVFHQIDEISAAGNELGCRFCADFPNGIGDVSRPHVVEVDHSLLPIAAIACSMAATMLG